MTPLDPEQLRRVVDELSNALQTSVLLAAKLATSLRADAHDADVLYRATARATEALRRLTPTNGGAQ
jgi:DNA-directed RNA polymerase subunit F